MEFVAPKSSGLKAMTAMVFVVLMALSCFVYYMAGEFSVLIISGSITAFIFGLSYYFSICKYRITETTVVIVRPFDSVTYPKSAMKAVERVDKKDLRFAIRTFGIGGVFAYTGQFWNKQFGSMTWYVTKMDNAVMMVSGSQKVVISPDNPEKFIAALQ